MGKKKMEQARELARLYYMQGDPQKLIAYKTGISPKSISKWVNEGGWELLRTAKTITRRELIQKMMRNASERLENKEMSYDEMSKLASSIEKLDKQTNVITIIEVFSSFNNWLISRMQIDKELSPEVVKTMNRYQDLFISEQMNGVQLELK